MTPKKPSNTPGTVVPSAFCFMKLRLSRSVQMGVVALRSAAMLLGNRALAEREEDEGDRVIE